MQRKKPTRKNGDILNFLARDRPRILRLAPLLPFFSSHPSAGLHFQASGHSLTCKNG